MKALIFLSVLFSTTVSFASIVTTLTCELEKYPNQKITFKMKDLGHAKATYLNIDPNDDYSPIFLSDSKNEDIQQIIRALNEQGGDLTVAEDRIAFFGDSAGIDFVDLVLYKNSNFTRGFVRTDFEFSTVKGYSKLACQLE